jgi:hypothetical protein
MATRFRTPSETERCLLRWVFHRGSADLTCEVDSHGSRGFDVQLLVGWSPVPSICEHFDNPIAALERHAELSQLLREEGWAVTEHTATV